jgi:iron complex transport system substrate-binding protein
MRSHRHCESSEAIQTKWRLPLDCCVALLLAVTVTGCAVQPPITPGKVISNNPCIDAILAKVAAPGQIGAVSIYSHDANSGSAPLNWARTLPALGMSAEEIIAAKPALVLTGNLSSNGTNAALLKAGVKIIGFGVPASVEESILQIRAISAAIGRVAAGERLVKRISTAVTDAPARAKKSAIIWQGGGFVAGKGTLQDELLSKAGYANVSATYGLNQWDILPAETLLRNPPDVIFMPSSSHGEEGRALSARTKLLRHIRGKARIMTFPDKLLFCGGPTIIDAMKAMTS